MANFVQFTLSDGSNVLFESAESDLVSPRGRRVGVAEGGKLAERLSAVGEAAEQISRALRSRLVPDEVALEFGLTVSGEVGWFFTKAHSEGTIKVTLKWAADEAPATARPTGKAGEP